MSIKVSSYVWEHSAQKGSALLLMLAIADHAHDDGAGAYPSIATLAKKARTSERNVKLLLAKLEDENEIEVERNAGPSRVNVYRVKNYHPAPERVISGASEGEKISPEGEKNAPQRVKSSSPKPSENRHKEPSVEVVAVPDDTTTTCLKILLSVAGFPRDQGENAIKLAEYREEFPAADPVEVCRDFKAWHEEHRKKPSRLRLRKFFKQANKPRTFQANSRASPPSPELSGAEGAKRRQEDYEWLFR